jgi:hypothetical protein
MEVIPEQSLEASWQGSGSERAGEEVRETAFLEFGEFDIPYGYESGGPSDRPTVVLPVPSARRFRWLYAARLTLVSLVLFAGGVSTRLLRRPSERGNVHEGPAIRHLGRPGSVSARRGPVASRRILQRTGGLSGRKARRRRARVRRRPIGPRHSQATPPTQRRVIPAGVGGVSRGEAGTAHARTEEPAPETRRPCLPGTLGC